jgi:hypothetical protein
MQIECLHSKIHHCLSTLSRKKKPYKNIILFCWFFFSASNTLSAQDILLKLSTRSFFDNTEYASSPLQTSQTMAGVHLTPEVGINWNSKHRVFVGADVMREFGTDKTISSYDPIIYYEYKGSPFRFYMGAFPRRSILDKYPRMFFQDSIANYCPVINGFFWEFSNYKHLSYANIWLDWTGRQTREQRESFFMGWSVRYNWKIFYLQHWGYMFHYALLKEAAVDMPLHDNGLLLTSLGIDLTAKSKWDKLEVNIGWSVGLDRNRQINIWNKPQGLLSEIKLEYRGLGFFNTYYKGEGQQIYYADHGGALYWGDPVYRAKEYDRLDFNIHFFKTNVVKLRFTYSFHYLEKQLYHEQALYATFDITNLKTGKKEKDYRYLWDNWLR